MKKAFKKEKYNCINNLEKHENVLFSKPGKWWNKTLETGPDQSAVTLETFHGGKYSFDPAAIVVQIVLCERL